VHIGGCTDLFDAWRNGSLQKRLTEGAVSYDTETQLDPYSLLPKWLHPRKTA
jgi:cysteine synthase A